MSNWRDMEIGKVILFNPPEKITKGKIIKKIAMDQLTNFGKKIKCFEIVPYISGPKFRNGDTLLAKITPCLENGKIAQVDILEQDEVAFGSSEFIVLRNNENTINNYVFYLAKSPVFRKKAISSMEGTSGRKRVNERALKLQILPVPDIPTQQKIANVLSCLDDKIELNNRINKELEAMAKTLYEYWFVQFDFPDANGKPYKTSGGKMVWNAELKREIPEGWEVGKISDIVTNVKEIPNNVIFPYIPIENLPIKKLVSADFAPNNEAQSSLILFKKYDILLGAMRVYFHRVCLATQDGITRTTVFVLRPKKDSLRYYSLFTINTDISINFAKKNSKGSTIPYTFWEQGYENFIIVIPEEKFLFSFNKIIYPIFETLIHNELENQTLANLRDWLLPMLMNGQVQVP